MKIRYFISAIITLFLFFSSCEKYEQEPVHYLTNDYVYDRMDKNGDYAEQVLNNLYSYLPQGFNRINNVVLDAATDDAIASNVYNDIEVLSQSRLNAISNNPDGNWYHAYEAIRNVNLFLANVDKVPVASTTIQYWKAEARFIRAISYFELIKRYGGVPLVGNSLFEQDEKLDIDRSSYDQCVNYIVAEMDAINDLLQSDPISSTELGHITQGAALALKSRVLLYAASPLNNPDNDLSKWQAAADAAKAVIDLNKFSLVNKFASVFLNRKNSEVILARQQGENKNLEQDNAPVGYAEPNQSNGYVSPTQELVEAFPMKNGLSINAAGSGYNPQDPYINRDPRLDATVFYNGAVWLSRPVETFEGGKDKPNSIQRQTRTGYYMRKFLGDFSNSSAYGNQDHNFIIFRYAEILLNYAEASNELGNMTIAYDQLKLLRQRAKITAGTGSLYGLKPDMTRDEMRTAIQNERRIEMAFEEQRYWDIRRWKIAEQIADKPLHGVKITRDQNGLFGYETVQVSKIQFAAPKMYLYPIPFSETAGNAASLVQNPGWE